MKEIIESGTGLEIREEDQQMIFLDNNENRQKDVGL